MARREYETLLQVGIDGKATELPCVLHYEHDEATGDGWNEPFYAERVTLERVEVTAESGKPINVLPVLDAQYVRSLEYMLLQREEREKEMAQ